jgi:hypothetical protein
MSEHEHKVSHTEEKQAKREAKKLLQSPRFFNQLLDVLEKGGLVGEKANVLVLYNVMSSRILPHPLSLFVKGRSSSGKNFLIKKVLRLFWRNGWELKSLFPIGSTRWQIGSLSEIYAFAATSPPLSRHAARFA